jgi:hypothetical protein
MKRSILMFLLIAMVAGALLAQAPAGGQAPGAGGGGGQRGAGGPGGGRGGGRGAPAPATGPIADAVNEIVTAINSQDVATLNKMVTPDAQWLDEDGHMPPASAWIPRFAMPGKKLTISNLRVAQPTPDTGWAAFNYTLEEAAGSITGMDSILFKKTGNDWQAVLIHAAVNTKAVTPH